MLNEFEQLSKLNKAFIELIQMFEEQSPTRATVVVGVVVVVVVCCCFVCLFIVVVVVQGISAWQTVT